MKKGEVQRKILEVIKELNKKWKWVSVHHIIHHVYHPGELTPKIVTTWSASIFVIQ